MSDAKKLASHLSSIERRLGNKLSNLRCCLEDLTSGDTTISVDFGPLIEVLTELLGGEAPDQCQVINPRVCFDDCTEGYNLIKINKVELITEKAIAEVIIIIISLMSCIFINDLFLLNYSFYYL